MLLKAILVMIPFMVVFLFYLQLFIRSSKYGWDFNLITELFIVIAGIIGYLIYISKALNLRAQINRNLSRVVLENNNFNKKFSVYSSDQVEARYLVTPSFMEKLYNINTAFGAKNINCSFFDDNLMIAIETDRDLFEFGNLFKPLHEGLKIHQFHREICAIFDLVDYFKLDENIYLQ